MSPAKPKKTVSNKSGAVAETAAKPSPAKARTAAASNAKPKWPADCAKRARW